MTDSRDLMENSCSQEKIIDTARSDPDWQVRRAAVENITDEKVLMDIINDELTSAVSIRAMEHINDREFLKDICLNHPDSHLRLACINRISDESLLSEDELSSLLEEMALNDPDFYVLKSVCENPNLDNQNVLAEVAKSNEAIRRQAIRRIRDESVLADFALNDNDSFIRREAILNPNLKDLDVIYDVIRLDEDEFNRTIAIYKIPDEESLLRIIFKKPLHNRLGEISRNITFSVNDCFLNILENETDEYRRQVAVNLISDEDVLKDIILSESNELIRADAIRNDNFTNCEMLEELISEKSSPEILFEAISKIENQETLKDYVKNNLKPDRVTLKAISRVNDLIFLESLLSDSDSKIRLEAVRRISQIENNRYLLHDVALTESDAEICLEAISAMDVRNDLIEVADIRSEKQIRVAALKHIKTEQLLYHYEMALTQYSLADLPFEDALKNMALNDADEDIRRIATAKLNDKCVLDEIASRGDVGSGEAQKRLNSLFEDIKCIKDERILNRLVSGSDRDVSRIALLQLEDLETWAGRISKIGEITDIDALKDIASNDFNYLVRSEAEGRIEKIIFNIRLDEIESKTNQERLKAIVDDGSFGLEIRRKALLKITDEEFIKIFEDELK